MLQKIKEQTFYHICVYENNDFEIGHTYKTNTFNRTYSTCQKEKQELEENLEKYRLKNRPNVPSRQKCLYICQYEDVVTWAKKLTKSLLGSCKIFKLSCTGEVFWCDAGYFDDIPIDDCSRYWAGCDPKDRNVLAEGLFYGHFEVTQEYDISTFLNNT